MSWPLAEDWTCNTCGRYMGLTWGIAHGVCRCDQCHTQYSMRDLDTGEITDTPRLMLKPEYIKPAQIAWETFHKPIDQISDDDWDLCFEKAALAPKGKAVRYPR